MIPPSSLGGVKGGHGMLAPPPLSWVIQIAPFEGSYEGLLHDPISVIHSYT